MGIIVLDKCFLQAASWQTVCGLAERHELIVTGSLFHEIMSGDPDVRRRIFAKLPRRDNPVHLINNLSHLLTHENQTYTPARNILEHTIGVPFRFNPHLREPGYELPQGTVEAVADNEELTRRLVNSYVERTNAVVDMFYRVTTNSDNERLIALAEIEEEISQPKNVLTFYRSLGDQNLPPANLLTPEWATFRSYQTSLLFSLHTIHRHRGPIPLPLSAREFERLEHDIHDHIALCSGILAGGLATEENKLKRWCTLLSPETLLVSG